MLNVLPGSLVLTFYMPCLWLTGRHSVYLSFEVPCLVVAHGKGDWVGYLLVVALGHVGWIHVRKVKGM